MEAHERRSFATASKAGTQDAGSNRRRSSCRSAGLSATRYSNTGGSQQTASVTQTPPPQSSEQVCTPVAASHEHVVGMQAPEVPPDVSHVCPFGQPACTHPGGVQPSHRFAQMIPCVQFRLPEAPLQPHVPFAQHAAPVGHAALGPAPGSRTLIHPVMSMG